MTTTGTRFRRIEEIVDAALDLPAAEREAFVRSACADDAGLLAEVSALLAAHGQAGDFLETAAVERFKGALLAEGERVGSYTIVRVLGSGGGGTVYLAEQDQPRRHVALKAMHGGFTTETAATRFQQEAEILARLQHPSIAHVYEAGVHDGMPFIALEYVQNATTILDAVEGEGRGARLRLFAEVCDAVHAGHLKGVVHRDLKPANILVLPSGHPKVIDFGIARVEEAGAATEVAGTPPYMSPEQCTPDTDVDLRSDVYSLGVVLYELLVGRLPHDVSGTPIVEAARRVRETAPLPLDGRVPADLRAIVEMAMARKAEARYPSAADLARDLRSFLGHRSVVARPSSRRHELRLFVRRNPALVGSFALLFFVLCAATLVSWRFASRAAEARDRERMQAYVATLAAANAALRNAEVGEAKRRLRAAAPELRGWEWNYLASRLDQGGPKIGDPEWLTFHAVPHPDGETIVEIAHEEAMEGDGSIALWSASTGELLRRTRFEEYPLSPPVIGTEWIAWGNGKGTILVAESEELEIVRRLECGEAAVYCLASSADGAELIAADYEGWIRVWETDGWTLSREFGDKERSYAAGPICSPDGSLVAIADTTSVVDLWDLQRGERVRILEGHTARVQWLRFLGADGKRILTGSADKTLRVWETATGRTLDEITGSPGAIIRGALSEDETRLLTGEETGTIRLWDFQTGTIVETYLGHEGSPSGLHFLPGERFLSADASGGIRLRELRKSAPTLGRYPKLVRDLDYSGDGQWIATASFDETVRLHRLGDAPEEKILLGHKYRVQSVDFSPDSKRLVSGGTDQTIKVWDVDSGECLKTLDHTARVILVACGASAIVSADVDNQVVLWDAETGRPIRSFAHGQWPTALILLPGNELLTSCNDGHLRLWDLGSGAQLRDMSFPDGLANAALAPDGRTVVVASLGPYDAAWRSPRASLHFIDLATWKRGKTIPGIAGAVAFSPDGTRLAATSGNRVLLLDRATGRTLLELHHEAWFQDVAFSADGTQLATAAGSYVGHGCELRLWGRLPGLGWPPEFE